MISVTEAKKLLAQHCGKGRISETELYYSLGRIVAEDVHSPMDVPSFDNSAMDGYAMRFDENRDSWEVVTTIQAGETAAKNLREGEAARIFTGAKIPEGADTVIQQELIEMKAEEKRIFYKQDKVQPGSNVRLKGSQCKEGERILAKGTKITPGVIGLLASVGVKRVKTFLPPKVAYIVTGNELREVGEELAEGEIYNSNGPMLEALLKQVGVEVVKALHVADDKESLQHTINKALDKNDILILSGGISVGDYDFVKECLENAAVKEVFYKIKQRPGKPMFAGKKDEKWVFALPGNPGSVLSCFIQYVKPCLRTIMGEEEVWQPGSVLPLKEGAKKISGLTFFMKGKKEDGEVRLLTGQQSFNLQAFSMADCLVELEEDREEVSGGTMVKVYDL